MITYRQVPSLRVVSQSSPQPPFWSRTTVSPYGSIRTAPLALDYQNLTLSAHSRVEVAVCDDVAARLLESAVPFDDPLLIDATESGEKIFGRAEQALGSLGSRSRELIYLTSTRGAIPNASPTDQLTLLVAAWPIDDDGLSEMFAALNSQGWRWGVVIPIVYPLTTDLAILQRIADLAAQHGAVSLSAIPFDLTPAAKHTIAKSISDHESYLTLFDSDLDTITVATERHVAALAEERQLQDFVCPIGIANKTNWNAAILLTILGTRMLRMKKDVELGWRLVRSAKILAELDKPIEHVAEAASLGIIEGLDPRAVEVVESWMRGGEPTFADSIHAQWRLRRDYGLGLHEDIEE